MHKCKTPFHCIHWQQNKLVCIKKVSQLKVKWKAHNKSYKLYGLQEITSLELDLETHITIRAALKPFRVYLYFIVDIRYINLKWIQFIGILSKNLPSKVL